MATPFRAHRRRRIGTRTVVITSYPRRSRRLRRGFTLVEILVVMAIIGLIMGLVGPQVMSVLGDARGKTAKVQIQNLGSALEVFYLDTGRYPTSEEGLSALVRRPGDADAWNGPYVRGGGLPKDPWGNAYVYAVPGRNGEPYEITSLGPNGRSGGIERVSAQR